MITYWPFIFTVKSPHITNTTLRNNSLMQYTKHPIKFKKRSIILRPASVVHTGNRPKNWPLFYDVLHAKIVLSMRFQLKVNMS